MVEGRYTGEISIDFHFDETKEGFAPYAEIEQLVMGGELTKELQDWLDDYLKFIGNATLTEHSVEIHRVENDS